MMNIPNRRNTERARTVFLPAYVERENRMDMAIMRDRSSGGARFSARAPFRVGEQVRYETGDGVTAHGIVKWCREKAFGVENTRSCTRLKNCESYGYRSIRIPFSFPVDLTAADLNSAAKLLNISLLGGCIETDQKLKVGKLLNLECFGAVFEAATVKWISGDKVGLKWGRAMKCGGLATFLDHLQQSGRSRFAPSFLMNR